MDPWLDSIDLKKSTQQFIAFSDCDSFEDNFKPDFIQQLPDSQEYLAILESKLERIKNDPNILKQLADKREDCMQQLMQGAETYCDETIALDTPINTSTVLRTILPQNTALTQGEIVKLVKYDQLIEGSEENTSDSEESINSQKEL